MSESVKAVEAGAVEAQVVEAQVAEAGEPTLEELLDNSPEAVAMRRFKAARAEAARKASEAAAQPKPVSRRETRRNLILGATLGGMGLARVLARAGSRGK